MTDKISTYGRTGLDISQARQREVARSESAGENRESPRADARSDAVSLSDRASFLKQVEARLKNQPEVDQARVDELRGKIQAGSYEISAEQIAAKLLRLEQGLG